MGAIVAGFRDMETDLRPSNRETTMIGSRDVVPLKVSASQGPRGPHTFRRSRRVAGTFMAGRHSKRRAHAQTIPVQRRPGIELVDAHTRITHRVTSDELLAGRVAGNYRALCGTPLVSASLTDPGRARCTECTR